MLLQPGSFLFVLTIAFVLAYLKRRNCGKRRPPGPRPVPLLGNVFGIDAQNPWKTYTKWAATFGELFYTQLLGQDIVVINSERVASDLLVRRSSIYSSRPASLYRVNQLFGTEFSSIFLPYGDRWRLHRRIFHQALNVNAALAFRPVQMRKTHELVMGLLTTPGDFATHLQALSTSLIMSIVYDYEVSSRNDPIVSNVETAIEIAMKEVKPEVAAVLNVFPFLEYVPAWFPGARLKRSALLSQRCVTRWVDAPFQYVVKNMVAGTAGPSMLSDTLTRIRCSTGTEEEAVQLKETAKEACASAYAAASETTFSTLSTFVLAMVLYPDIQKRAHAEIDAAIGSDLARLPEWEDRSSLPYVDATIKETLRWHPVAPLGIPHATVKDDVYEGYFIPKGATVLVNAWALSRDPIKYPNPDEFLPERFLASDKAPVDGPSFAYGFGRRVCVGRHVADATLWAAVVNILALFQLEPMPGWDLGEKGENVVWTEGVTTHPKFPCKITPRHEGLNEEKVVQLMKMAA